MLTTPSDILSVSHSSVGITNLVKSLKSMDFMRNVNKSMATHRYGRLAVKFSTFSSLAQSSMAKSSVSTVGSAPRFVRWIRSASSLALKRFPTKVLSVIWSGVILKTSVHGLFRPEGQAGFLVIKLLPSSIMSMALS